MDIRAIKDIVESGMRFYIHPDSLPLLGGQENDLGLDTEDTPCSYSVYHGGWVSAEAVYKAPHTHESKAPIRIIQRNGLAFMWPESEEG